MFLSQKKRKSTDSIYLAELSRTLSSAKSYFDEKKNVQGNQDLNFGLLVADALAKITTPRKKHALMAKILDLISEFDSDEN